jgi:uncharacterized protein (UPF0332 family)
MTKESSKSQNPYEKTLNHAMSLWFLPEVERRQTAGLIPKPFPLLAAQVIIHLDGRPHEIRLNDEVRAILDVKYKEGVGDKTGKAVFAHEIERLNFMELPQSEDPNCGHFTTIQFEGKWYLAFDFVYNKGRARELLAIGREFLESAADALPKRNLRAFADTLFSAAEIAANVILLITPRPNGKRYAGHGVIHSRFNQFAKYGNVQSDESASFNKLAELRSRARYGKGTFHLTSPRAGKLLKDVRNLFERANQLVSRENGVA